MNKSNTQPNSQALQNPTGNQLDPKVTRSRMGQQISDSFIAGKSDAVDNAIGATLTKTDPKGFNTSFNEIQNSAQYETRGKERGLINEKTGASIVVRDNGQINTVAGLYAQYNLSAGGKSIERTLESNTITNRKRLTTDEIVVNEHKFNPLLWELTDFKKINLSTNEATIVGNLCMTGSVLTKSWDFNLKRYVLIRRPWRGPVFSPLLNVPEIKSAVKIHDPLQVDDDILANSDKGYHVNSLISDAKSLVGKEGVDREGIDRGFKKVFGPQSAGETAAMIEQFGQLGGGNTDPKTVWDCMKKAGYNDISCAVILGNIQQESHFNTKAVNSYGYTGLCQWDHDGRWAALVADAQSKGKDPYDAGTQLDWLVYEATQKRYPEECSPDGMNKHSTIEEAAHAWLQYFEGALGQEEAERLGYAKAFYDKFKGQ